MNPLTRTLEEMPFVFSSNAFAKKAQRNGVSKAEINNGVLPNFLHKHATQLNSRRMRQKKTTAIRHDVTNILEAIELLKKNNYKVMKQVTDWIEV